MGTQEEITELTEELNARRRFEASATARCVHVTRQNGTCPTIREVVSRVPELGRHDVSKMGSRLVFEIL